MKKQFYYALVACVMLAWACNNPNAASKAKEAAAMEEKVAVDAITLSPDEVSDEQKTVLGSTAVFTPPTVPAEEPLANAPLPVVKQKLIKDGRLSIKTTALHEGKTFIDAVLKKYGGYYQQEELNNQDYTTAFSLKIRIPANAFDVVLQQLEQGSGEITSKEISTRDVTEEFVDLQLRLNNKKKYLKRYQEILSRAASVKELMAVQENIRTLEEELESAEGRLRYLNDQVLYSSLDVYLFTEKPYVHKAVKEVHFLEKLKTAFSNGWGGIVETLLFVARIWPLCLMAALVWWLLRIYRSRKNKTSK